MARGSSTTKDPEALIGSYVHLTDYPMPSYALDILRRVGSLVKPIMRKHNFRISRLAEFYPEPSLYGLNTSYPGSSRLPFIQLRLRQPYDNKVFLPYESIVDTMCHELTHCVHGPHDEKFYKLYRVIQGEVETLIMGGYTGEGFLSKGQALGGTPRGLRERERVARIRDEEAKRRKANEGKGRTLGTTPGHRLGGSSSGLGSGSGSGSGIRGHSGSGSGSSSRGNSGSGSGLGSGSGSRPTGARTVSTPNTPSPYATANQLAAEAAIRRNRDKSKSGSHKPSSSRSGNNASSSSSSSSTATPLTTTNTTGPRFGTSNPTKGCPGVRHATPREVDEQIARMNGFETVADMEDANEMAIMQAAIELLEEADLEDETRSNTLANEWLTAVDTDDNSNNNPPKRSRTAPATPRFHEPGGSSHTPILVSSPERPEREREREQERERSRERARERERHQPRSRQWACKTCTFINEESHLQCICGEVRPDLDGKGSSSPAQRRQSHDRNTSNTVRVVSSVGVGGGGSNGKRRADPISKIPAPEESYWVCHRCDNVISHEWWSCTRCGCIKLTS